MKRVFLLAMVSGFAGMNAGCAWLGGDEGYFRSRSLDYQQAREVEPLQLPENARSVGRAELYPVPAVRNGVKGSWTPDKGDDVPLPQGLLSFNEEAGVEVREKDDRRWLVVRKPTADVFALTRSFVESNGFSIAAADAGTGVIETEWLKPREEDQPGFFSRLFTLNFADNYDRFRFVIDEQSGASRVQIDQVREQGRSVDGLSSSVDWEDDGDESSLTRIMANDLSDYIAEEQANAYRTGVLAAAYANAPRTIMTWDGNGFPVLVITQDMNRAWVAVGNALERSQVKVFDLNRSLGVYYVARNARAKADDEDGQYQLKLLRADEGVHVSVQLDDNTLAPAAEAEVLLNRLKDAIE